MGCETTVISQHALNVRVDQLRGRFLSRFALLIVVTAWSWRWWFIGGLYVTFMSGQIHDVATTVTLPIPTTMGMFFVDFVVGMASATGLEGVTPSTGTMILEAIRTIKITRPNRTKRDGVE